MFVVATRIAIHYGILVLPALLSTLVYVPVSLCLNLYAYLVTPRRGFISYCSSVVLRYDPERPA
jgi:hypothetical protein